jgi:Outer membrane efflux protein
MNPSDGSTSLTLSQVITSVLAHNPMIQSARAKWFAAKERVPQAAAWEDLKVGTNIVLGRFVSVPANAFTDQMVSVEQMIPLSGKNRSKERAAAAEALGAFEEARRQELDVIAKTKASYYQIANFYQLLDINHADEASLVHLPWAIQLLVGIIRYRLRPKGCVNSFSPIDPKPSRRKPARMQKIPVKSASTTESEVRELAWAAVSGTKVVPIMGQVAASGLTTKWRDVPKIAYTSKGRIAAYKPTTGSKPISSAYAMAVGNATAATDTPATASCRSHSR